MGRTDVVTPILCLALTCTIVLLDLQEKLQITQKIGVTVTVLLHEFLGSHWGSLTIG